jgi:hypothetical protein
MKLFDPTAPPVERASLVLAGRPADLRGLRVGLVENTKFNSETLLRKLGARLARDHGMTVVRVVRKRSPSHAVDEESADILRRVCDFVVSGVGD